MRLMKPALVVLAKNTLLIQAWGVVGYYFIKQQVIDKKSS
jgi:hypothetical protein